MTTRKLTKAEVAATPYKTWNAYIDLLANENHDNLAPEQRPAHLVFWYESEVQNGGHLQYFENRRGRYLQETVAALRALGASNQASVLTEAIALWKSVERSRIEPADEFCEEALEGEFSNLDQRFHECSPSLQECLEKHLEQNRSSFVTIE